MTSPGKMDTGLTYKLQPHLTHPDEPHSHGHPSFLTRGNVRSKPRVHVQHPDFNEH
jgi:hypothetical protein